MLQQRGQAQSVAIHRIELPTPYAVGPVNSFLMVVQDKRILVDCGPPTPAARAALEGGLRDLGYSLEDLTGLVLTHGHIDHVGLTATLQQMGVPVYAHPEVQTWLQPGGTWDLYRTAFYARLYREMGMGPEDLNRAMKELSFYHHWNDRSVVDVPLLDGCVFPEMPVFRVLYVPGHAQAAIALWNQETGELVVGDQLLPQISSNALVEPLMNASSGEFAARTYSLLDYRRNLEALAALPIRKVYPGHGDVFTGAHDLIQTRLGEQTERKAQFMQLLLENEPCTAFDLALQFFPRHRNQGTLILSETLGYLDWLEREGAVREAVDEHGVIRWTARRP